MFYYMTTEINAYIYFVLTLSTLPEPLPEPLPALLPEPQPEPRPEPLCNIKNKNA